MQSRQSVQHLGFYPFAVKFSGKVIEQVDQYKYVRNITRSIKMYDEDIFSENYAYLCDQAHKALFLVRKRTIAWVNCHRK